MLFFENPEFFNCTLITDEVDLTAKDCFLAVSLTIRSKKFGLEDQPNRIGFSTIIFRFVNQSDRDEFATHFIESGIKPGDMLSYIGLYIREKHLHTEVLNRYTDGKFDDVIERFSRDVQFGSVIIYINTEKPPLLPNVEVDLDPSKFTHQLLIAAIPIEGMLSPITKSPFYKLYNANFIACKKVKTNSGNEIHCNGFIFVFVEIKASFTINQFIPSDWSGDYGSMKQTIWTLEMLGNELTPLIFQLYELSKTEIVSAVTYAGNEKLFEKPNRNLFHLSDIPSDVINRGESITKKLT